MTVDDAVFRHVDRNESRPPKRSPNSRVFPRVVVTYTCNARALIPTSPGRDNAFLSKSFRVHRNGEVVAWKIGRIRMCCASECTRRSRPIVWYTTNYDARSTNPRWVFVCKNAFRHLCNKLLFRCFQCILFSQYVSRRHGMLLLQLRRGRVCFRANRD